MEQTRPAFHLSIVLLSLLGLSLVTEVLPVYAGPFTADQVGIWRRVVVGVDNVTFDDIESFSPGVFNETASGSGVVAEPRHFSGAASQLSNISLLGDVLIVDAAMETNLKISAPSQDFPTEAGAALSILNVGFTLRDWASYSVTDFLVGSTPSTGSFGIQEVSIIQNLIGSELRLFHHNPSDSEVINDTHGGLLAPGSYLFVVNAAVYPQGPTYDVFSRFTTSLVVTNVPEPSSLLLLVCGVGLLAASRWTGWTQQTL